MVRWCIDSQDLCKEDSMETSGQDLHGHDRSSDVVDGGRLSGMSVISKAAEWIERIDPGSGYRLVFYVFR